MGFKCRLIVSIALVFLLFVILGIIIYYITLQKEENYSDKLISVFSKQRETTVQDVFLFKFDRAYIFDDCYISGEGLAQKYNLDISINEVQSGVNEDVQRIVFVDELGDFIYEFKCDNSEVIILEEGIVIYPETVIERTSSTQEEILSISFRSIEHYDD